MSCSAPLPGNPDRSAAPGSQGTNDALLRMAERLESTPLRYTQCSDNTRAPSCSVARQDTRAALLSCCSPPGSVDTTDRDAAALGGSMRRTNSPLAGTSRSPITVEAQATLCRCFVGGTASSASFIPLYLVKLSRGRLKARPPPFPPSSGVDDSHHKLCPTAAAS